jgi:hypothetical protein
VTGKDCRESSRRPYLGTPVARRRDDTAWGSPAAVVHALGLPDNPTKQSPTVIGLIEAAEFPLEAKKITVQGGEITSLDPERRDRLPRRH